MCGLERCGMKSNPANPPKEKKFVGDNQEPQMKVYELSQQMRWQDDDWELNSTTRLRR